MFPATLNPGKSAVLQVSFDPTVAGATSGSITISSNSSSGTISTVTLSGTGTAAPTPRLTLSANTLAFGSVTLKTTSTRTLTLTSSGTAALRVNSVTLAGAGFALSGATFPATLNPGQSVVLQVSFDPTVAGAVSGTITISSNSSSGATNTVTLSGTGTAAPTRQLTLSANTLAFGSVTMKTTSTKTLTLTSSGTAALTINSAAVVGAGYAISGATFPATLNPGQSVVLQVSFDPTVAGAVSGSITISSNSSSGVTSTVTLSGTGTAAPTPKLTLSANTLAFGSVTVKTTSTRTLTLTSSGTAALRVNSVTPAGAGFALSGATFPATLNPGQSVVLQVSFDPTVAGAASGTIAISSNSSSGATSTVTLSGTGTAAPTPQLTLSANTLAFGSVTMKTNSTKTLTLTSSGTAALTINSAAVVGAGYAISGATFPATLNPGQSVVLQVSFNPTVAGATSGTITISSNSSSGATSAVTLSGTGTAAPTPQLTLSANALAFGSVTVKTTSTKTLTLTSSGTAALTISSAAVVGAGYAISGATLPATINPGQTVVLQVSFDPTVAGAVSGTITISSNSSTGATATVSLSGTGTTPTNPVLTVSTAALNFGDDPVGTTATLSVTLTSTGTSPVTVSAAGVTGAGFTFSGATFPVTLNPSIAISIQVQFDPTAVGAASGTLSFASNSTTGATSVVSLSGTGTAASHKVSLSWSAPVNSPVPVTGYDIYRATSGSTSFALLSSADTQTSYVDLSVVTGTTYTYYVTSVNSTGTQSAPSNQVTVTIP
jgi:citrate lyase synthetase